MTQSVPRSSPVPRLLFLSLLLLFLLVPAQSWALHLEIMQPRINNFQYPNQLTWLLTMVKDSPIETLWKIAKLEVYIDDQLAAQLPATGGNYAQPGPDYVNWIYRPADGVKSVTHTFRFRAWVWKSVMIPPNMIPQWTTEELALQPVSTETVLRLGPTLDAGAVGDGSSPDRIRIQGRANSLSGQVTVTIRYGQEPQGTAVPLDAGHQFDVSYGLIPGDNVFTVTATDAISPQLQTTHVIHQRYDPVSATVSPGTFTADGSATATVEATPSLGGVLSADVWDPLHRQRVAHLVDEQSVAQGGSLIFQWDGHADPHYPYMGSNGLVISGMYRVKVTSSVAAGATASGWCDLAIDVTNASPCPAWSLVEAESSPAPITLTGGWQTLLLPDGCGSLGLMTVDPTASCGFAFSDEHIDIVYADAIPGGGAMVSVDGQAVGQIAASVQNGGAGLVYPVTGLGVGPHQLSITPLPTGDGVYGFVIDAFRVY